MKLVSINKLPDKVYRRHMSQRKSVKQYLVEFMKMNVKYAKVVYSDSDYVHNRACVASFRHAITSRYAVNARPEYPIIVREINNDVYLIRTDMED